MSKKRKVLFLGLVAALVLIVSPLFPQMQTTVSAAGTSLNHSFSRQPGIMRLLGGMAWNDWT